jgi:hypothetical protein
MSQRTRNSLVKTVFYFFSPFILAIIFCFVVFIIDINRFQGDTKEWTHYIATFFVPAFFILGAAYLIVRLIATGRVLWIWLIELLLILFLFLYLI